MRPQGDDPCPVMQPDEGDHPHLHELWRAAASPRTVWRLRYNLPPNDPRFLDMTDAEIVDDLLLRMYHDLRVDIAHNPALGVKTNRAECRRLDEIARSETATQELVRQMKAAQDVLSPKRVMPSAPTNTGTLRQRAWKAVTGGADGRK